MKKKIAFPHTHTKKIENKIADKSTSPTHQRTISLSDIRLARLTTTVSDQQLTDVTLQTTALNSSNNSTSGSTIIAIKQESLSSVDNLVGSFVDSTTFLTSPNNQIANAHMLQSSNNNNSLTNEANGINEGMKDIKKKFMMFA